MSKKIKSYGTPFERVIMVYTNSDGVRILAQKQFGSQHSLLTNK